MAASQPSGGSSWWRRHWLVLMFSALGLIVLGAYAGLAVTVLPAWIVSMDHPGPNADDNTRLKAMVDTRNALLGVLAPVVVAIGAVAAFLNYRETSAQNRRTYELSQKTLDETQRQNRETLDVTRRGQLTERFTKAIEQLGQTDEDKLDIRLGGIYALEQIAKESEELHRPVMEILTAFVREHSRKPREASAELAEGKVAASTQSDAASTEQAVPLRADFQAIATVLGRREVSHDPDGFRLDLRDVALDIVDFAGAQLHKAWFVDAQLQGASFAGARLKGASFLDAHLEEAYFGGAQLQRADFFSVQLRKANFRIAHLQKATFHNAQLRNANFRSAHLQKATFHNAQLQEAEFLGAQLQEADFLRADLERARFRLGETNDYDALGLTPEQFATARNVGRAALPHYLARAPES